MLQDTTRSASPPVPRATLASLAKVLTPWYTAWVMQRQSALGQDAAVVWSLQNSSTADHVATIEVVVTNSQVCHSHTVAACYSMQRIVLCIFEVFYTFDFFFLYSCYSCIPSRWYLSKVDLTLHFIIQRNEKATHIRSHIPCQILSDREQPDRQPTPTP